MGYKEKYIIKLSGDERKTLFELIEKSRANKEKLNRARILLKADSGENGENWTDEQIANAFYVSISTVHNTRKSLVEEGFEATLERSPQKTKRKKIIQGEEEAYLVALACSAPPAGRCKWTLRLLADKMIELKYVEAISHMTVRDALKKTKLNLGKKKNGAFRQELVQDSSAKWKKS